MTTLETPKTTEATVRPAAGVSLHRQGLTGRGVGIAVIDSGVTAPGAFGRRLVTGPDFTVDAGTADDGRDHTGHGTHLAGIAAGDQVGVAPGSHVVSVKVAGRQGATDVNAVIAAIDWTVAHRHELSIGVLLLAFGADQLPAGRFDPLASAVARAWRSGIVVVSSAGNGGREAPLSTPTHIPEIITVAGAEQIDSQWVLTDFSDRGTDACRPDLAAPARSIVGPIAPGSDSEQAPETSIVADGFVKGSGTSQAAAVVAGAAALLLEADKSLTPDEIKRILTVSAARMDDVAAGAGALDLDVALACLASGLFRTTAPAIAGAWAGHAWTGHSWNGSLRGTVTRGTVWSGLVTAWTGHSWNGHSWNGHCVDGSGVGWSQPGPVTRGPVMRGRVWSGLVTAGPVTRGTVTRGTVWSGLATAGTVTALDRSLVDRSRVDGLEWAGHAWTVTRGMVWRGPVTPGTVTRGTVWSGLVTAWTRSWPGPVTPGTVTRGTAWSGLATAGTVTRGTASSGPATAGTVTRPSVAGASPRLGARSWAARSSVALIPTSARANQAILLRPLRLVHISLR